MSAILVLDGRTPAKKVFLFMKLDEDGTGNYFETSQAKTAQPTLNLNSSINPETIKSGRVKRIHFQLKPTNAVTYTLRLYSYNIDGTTNPYELNSCLIFESSSLRASDVEYDLNELDIPFMLASEDTMYYAIEWSGAPGDTLGFIQVSGEM